MYGARWPEFFELPKLMIRDITGTHRIEATLDESGYYCDHTVLCALRKCDVAQWKKSTPAQIAASCHYNLPYLAGLIASKLVSAYYYLVLTGEGVRTGGGFHTYPHTIRKLPVYQLDFSKSAHVQHQQHMTQLVSHILSLQNQFAGARAPQDRMALQRQIDATDREIDRLVYDLYSLNDEEIKLIEAAVA